MKMKVLSVVLAISIVACLFSGLTFSVSAETENGYYYFVWNGEATINGVDSSISGDIIIPSTLGGCPVTSIGHQAFYGCTGLTSVTIGNSVTSIGGYAFYGCTNLASVEIPNSVTNIGAYVFMNCTGLTNIVIPDSVTSIGEGAFDGCTGLTSVTIGNGVTNIGERAFIVCAGLTKVNYTGTIDKWCNIDFKDSASNPLYYAHNLYINDEEIESIIITDSVTSIGDYAFEYCTGLTSVTIGDSVTKIGSSAFYGCTGLTSIEIPDSVISIGDWAFYDTAWESNQLGEVVYAGKVLYRCNSYNTSIELRDDTLGIADFAFVSPYLTSIKIPSSVINIGKAITKDCKNLTSIVVDEGNSRYYSSGNCLIETETKSLIAACKDSIIPTDGSVTSIGDYVFCEFNELTSITIPDSVTSIGVWAFRCCTGLTSVTLGNSVTNIGDQAFFGCTNLRSIVIPSSVTNIEYSTFGSCTAITDVYYTGTEEDWNNLTKYGNDDLTNATIHYNYVPHTHTFGEKWSFDKANHWKVCTNVNCNEIDSLAAHEWNDGVITKAPTCAATGVKTYTCKVCKTTKTETIKKTTTHTSDGGKVTTKATLSKAGTKTEKCKVCGKVLKTTSIAFPKTIKISATSYTYDGKVKKPTVSVKDSNNKTIASSNYTVTYSSGCKNVGKYSVKITFKGNYNGTKTFTYSINPKGTTVSKLTAPKTKQITVAIKKNATQTTGYQIQYSTSKTFASGNKTATVTSNKTTTKTLTGLTKGKTYYVRIRTYKTVGKTKYYSAWSKAKSVKTK